MLAIAEPSARLRLVWIRLSRAARTAASVSGASTSSAITTPTLEIGAPTASTPDSIVGDAIFASPTTATRQSTSSPRLAQAVRSLGAACTSSSSAAVPTGRK